MAFEIDLTIRNAQGAAGDSEHFQDFLDTIDAENQGVPNDKLIVIGVNESHWEEKWKPEDTEARPRDPQTLQKTVNALTKMGFDVLVGSDNDVNSKGLRTRPDRTGLMVAVKKGHGKLGTVRMGRRDALTILAANPETDEEGLVVVQHWNDDKERSRLESLRGMPRNTAILAGDLNCTHGDDLIPRIVDNPVFRKIADKIPEWEFDFTHAIEDIDPDLTGFARQKEIARLVGMKYAHLFKRTVYMTEGTAMSELTARGFIDADPRHRATVKLGPLPFLQVDRIVVNKNLAKVLEFERLSNPNSDHAKRLRATILLGAAGASVLGS